MGQDKEKKQFVKNKYKKKHQKQTLKFSILFFFFHIANLNFP